MGLPETDAVRPELPSTPPEDPAEASTEEIPDIDLDACELDALATFLDGNLDHLGPLADRCPRRVPPKARRSPERLRDALVARWAWPEARAYFRIHMTGTLVHLRFREDGLAAVAEVHDVLSPNALIWWAVDAAGCTPQEAYATLGDDERRLFAFRQDLLKLLADDLRLRRDEKYEQGDDARARAARAEAERLTKQLRWRADQAEEKERRAAAQVQAVARDKEAAIRRLQEELASARRRLAEVETENAELRAAFEEAGRIHHEAVAALTRQVRELAVAARSAGAAVPPLLGERVLVVGDDSHKVDYRRTVEELGGSFAFYPGFEAGPRLDAALASATLAVYVAAYAAHKAQDHVRRAERAGLAVIMVPVAGAEAFRRAIQSWCGGRGQPSGRQEGVGDAALR